MNKKTLSALEYNKILSSIADYAVLDGAKKLILAISPYTKIAEVNVSLDKTLEAYDLIFSYNVGSVPYFDDIDEELNRVKVGGSLNMAELLKVSRVLSASRVFKSSVLKADYKLNYLQNYIDNISVYPELEKEINFKIISDEEVSDFASENLAKIRKDIKSLNNRIREKLNSYMRGSLGNYVQDNLVMMRGDRYVVPVKSEYRSAVKGLIHDQSSSGATLFIEPEQIIELNNDLKSLLLDEQKEILKILYDLSVKVSAVEQNLRWNIENLIDIDVIFAKAVYSYKFRCTRPIVNDEGIIEIIRGRHPLIDRETVVPVTVKLGKGYTFLLITGPNTGGKTVSLKLTGLLTLMAMSGIFIPAESGSVISVFERIFCDIGDEQSIEQSLSTFSSHIKNIINITRNLNDKTLVLIDEIGAGTDPDEGSALALAVIEKLLSSGCYGIITTHYSRLKEFAYSSEKLENASMDFDAETFAPLYKLNIGIPGSSNALEISRRLGISKEIYNSALTHMSGDKVSFENILRQAEASRQSADEKTAELDKVLSEKKAELEKIQSERKALEYERTKIVNNARIETRKLVNERLEEAEELISELKAILKRAEIDEGDLLAARTIKNKLANEIYKVENDAPEVIELRPIDLNSLKEGDVVFVKQFESDGIVKKIDLRKKQVEVSVGTIVSFIKAKDLFIKESEKKEPIRKKDVQIAKKLGDTMPVMEINILGQTVAEGVESMEKFIDQAVVSGIKEIKVIHGFGTGLLRKGIWEALKKNKFVKEYRQGRYGEGEKGVTVITLK